MREDLYKLYFPSPHFSLQSNNVEKKKKNHLDGAIFLPPKCLSGHSNLDMSTSYLIF